MQFHCINRTFVIVSVKSEILSMNCALLHMTAISLSMSVSAMNSDANPVWKFYGINNSSDLVMFCVT